MPNPEFKGDVVVIGGCGHVGLPLAITFADCGLQTYIYDIDKAKIAQVGRGEMPFHEEGGPEMLRRVIDAGRLHVSDRPDCIRDCKFIVMIVGTPVDEHLNPKFSAIHRSIEECRPYLRDGQILILRSTVFPGTTEHLRKGFLQKGPKLGVAFCPERVAQGFSLKEFRELPQIISSFDKETLEAVKSLFGRFTSEFVEMEPMEAELAKLMTNAWRYIQFATVNQFFMVANEHGLDFNRILKGCRYKYPRTAGMPGPGFAAGPCLVKDTMQLAAFSRNTFVLGHSAMLINEGLPYHMISMVKQETDLSEKTAGILGMAFKGESDDPRDSLSYKLRKLLSLEAKNVLCSDPYVKDPILVPQERLLAEADVVFIGAPHKAYRSLKLRPGVKLVDVWNCVGKEKA